MFAFLLSMSRALASDPPSSPPQNSRTWTTANKALGASSLLAILADVLTTHAGLARGATEANPVLGRRPTAGTVNTMAGLGALANLGIGALLPSKARNWWLGGMTGLELLLALHNSRMGGRRVTVGGSIPVGGL